MAIYTYIVIIIISLLIIFTNNKKEEKNYAYTKWFQCYDKRAIHKVFHTALERANIKRTDNNDWDVYLPCNSKYDMRAIKKIPITNKNQLINIIPQNGILGSKEQLWRILDEYYGREKASKIMPRSYILPKDIHYLNVDYKKDRLYVLKTEEQRQKGITITNDYDVIVRCGTEDPKCKIIQNYVPNTLIYRGHKINFRVYLLIICGSSCYNESYVYSDGIVSYAKDIMINNNNNKNPSFDAAVASFYTSKELYDKGYPILISQLADELNIDNDMLFSKFRRYIKDVIIACKRRICRYKYRYDNKSFQIFGVDFLLTDDLVPYILEINIGPGMIPYNETDKRLREDIHSDILHVLGITKTDSKFVRIN